MKSFYSNEDPELLTLYYAGNNDVVFIWVFSEEKYFKILFTLAHYYLQDRDEKMGVLMSVCENLIKKETDRYKELFLVNNKVESLLRTKTKSRAIDYYRKYKKRFANLEQFEHHTVLLEDHSFLNHLEDKMLLEQLTALLKQKYGEYDVIVLNLMLLHGPGSLKPMAEELGLTTDEMRKVKQKTVRRARAILITLMK